MVKFTLDYIVSISPQQQLQKNLNRKRVNKSSVADLNPAQDPRLDPAFIQQLIQYSTCKCMVKFVLDMYLFSILAVHLIFGFTWLCFTDLMPDPVPERPER
jgi:hypothetical protein